MHTVICSLIPLGAGGIPPSHPLYETLIIRYCFELLINLELTDMCTNFIFCVGIFEAECSRLQLATMDRGIISSKRLRRTLPSAPPSSGPHLTYLRRFALASAAPNKTGKKHPGKAILAGKLDQSCT